MPRRLRSFLTYYVRSALPFVTGLAFGLFLFRVDLPLAAQVVAGMVLVVVGPLLIQTILVLLVEALRGMPEEDAGAHHVESDAEPVWEPPSVDDLRSTFVVPDALEPEPLEPGSPLARADGALREPVAEPLAGRDRAATGDPAPWLRPPVRPDRPRAASARPRSLAAARARSIRTLQRVSALLTHRAG